MRPDEAASINPLNRTSLQSLWTTKAPKISIPRISNLEHPPPHHVNHHLSSIPSLGFFFAPSFGELFLILSKKFISIYLKAGVGRRWLGSAWRLRSFVVGYSLWSLFSLNFLTYFCHDLVESWLCLMSNLYLRIGLYRIFRKCKQNGGTCVRWFDIIVGVIFMLLIGVLVSLVFFFLSFPWGIRQLIYTIKICFL